jgi:tetratricopeptide (TPR) repeat protein
LPIAGGPTVETQQSPIHPAWQRWNDYGIACFLEGNGPKRGNFRQAEQAFRTLLSLGEPEAVPHGHLNLARVYLDEGRLDDAARALEQSGKCSPPAPAWSRAWFTALVNSQTATRAEHLDAVIADLEKILDPANQPRDRKFDFTRDYVVWNTLANRLYQRRKFEAAESDAWHAYIHRAIQAANRVLQGDAEDLAAHDLLALAYGDLAGSLDNPTMGKLSAAEVLAAAHRGADAAVPIRERLDACQTVSSGLPALPTPKLATLRELITLLQPAFAEEADPEMRAALAGTLSRLHRESHAIYNPDENARSRAARLYRQKNPAANYAAGDRVIYPTTPAHREAIRTSGELPPPS